MVAMPLLCLPQCLFAGAIVPVSAMAFLGKAATTLISDRWTFESLGRGVGLNDLIGDSPSDGPLLAYYGDSFSGSVAET